MKEKLTFGGCLIGIMYIVLAIIIIYCIINFILDITDGYTEHHILNHYY